MDNKKFFTTSTVNLKNANVSHVKMPYEIDFLARDLLLQATNTNIKVAETRNLLNGRSVEGRAGEENAENLSIQNLIYEGKENIFDGKI
jgi:hypothetical protein